MSDTTICICTFRRESIGSTLRSIACQQPVELARVPIVVVDNDDTPVARERIVAAGREAGVALRYVHAPARNISIARNAAMDAVETCWAAFIDDDEDAAPDWLARLIAARQGAEAVIGQSRAIYGADLPGWVARCDFHSNRMTGRADNAYTSNALLDMAFVRANALRFRPELGQTGGEDTLFFRAFALAGGRIAYCPESVVDEPVPASRADMRWVLRRRYRAGQTHGLMLREYDARGWRMLGASAAAKLAVSAAMALLTLPGSDRSRRWIARGALHAGALSYRLSPAILKEYGGS